MSADQGQNTAEGKQGSFPDVFCPQCPEYYKVADLKARARDGREAMWGEVLLHTARQKGFLRFLPSKRSNGGLTIRDKVRLASEGWAPECPEGHTLVDSLDPALVIGVVGNIGSSKSHYLAGASYEMLIRQDLRHLDLDVAYIGDTGEGMDRRIAKVYQDGDVLGATPRGTIDGPFSYRLTFGAHDAREQKSIVFFDVAGEDTATLADAANFVRHLFHAAGIIVLLDPDGFPTPGRPLESRGDRPLVTRKIIDTIAEVIKRVTGADPKDRDQIIVVTIAKADRAGLPEELWPPRVWAEGADAASTRNALRQYSTQCRQALIDLECQGIVDAAEIRFGSENVLFAAVSATGQDAVDGKWPEAEPLGCSIPVAQVICFGTSA